MLNLLTLYLGSGALLVILSLPLIAKKVKPNPFYGFRVKRTLENPEFWYATNAYFAKRQLMTGLGTMIASLGLYFWPGLGVDAYALACLAVFTLIFGFAIVQSMAYLKDL